jgi:hypothetical protein
VWTDHPEQRPPSLCFCRWHRHEGQPRSQLSTAMERRAEPGPAGHPAQSSDRGTLARSATLGPHTSLVQGPKLSGGRKPINAKCETVRNLPTFRDAYRLRRCIVPVDGFFEWKAIKGQKVKQPHAIAMKDGAPLRHWRHLGKLEGPRYRRVDQDVRGDYHQFQRARGRNP